MKTYFTKYLPVEGEMTCSGECKSQFKFAHKPAKECINCGGLLTQDNKLFLCSRDIQVGDDIQHTSGENGVCDEIIGDALHFSGDIEGHYSSINQWFKVIGKISPDAVWVTEGMEFDDDEIGFFIAEIFDEESENDSIIDYKTWSKTEGIKYIGIKCPTCKQFH